MEANAELISKCGLYCGNCPRYKKEKCKGCAENEKATWCKIRTCCIDKNIKNCADCDEYPDVRNCKHYKSFMAKVMSVLFNSDRPAAVDMIKETGYDDFATYMADNKLVTIKRRRKK